MHSNHKKSILLLITFLILNTASFSFPEAGIPDEGYVIFPDDVLDIKVSEDDKLSLILPVDKDGTITLPYLGKVNVSGLTTKEAARLIAQRLKTEDYLLSPQVTISVNEYRGQKVMVFGLVENPGTHILKGKTKVLDLLSQVASKEDGSDVKMIIKRELPSGKEETIDVNLYALLMNGDLSQNLPVLPGDHITISRISTPDETYALSEDYVIFPDDVLDINVWKDDNLTKILPVDKDGTITLPYLNKVKVAGLTLRQAADFIAQRLKTEDYLLSPQVTISVKEYRGQKVMVFGLVQKPGVYYLKGKTLILDLLSQIGGNADNMGGKMVIVRKGPSGEEKTLEVDLRALFLNGDLSQNIQILPGDHITISRISTAQQIYVLGEVKRPGPYTIERDLSVLETLRMAGGFTDFANQRKVKIIREEDGKKKNIIVNLNKIRKGDKSEDIILKAGDVLVALRSWF